MHCISGAQEPLQNSHKDEKIRGRWTSRDNYHFKNSYIWGRKQKQRRIRVQVSSLQSIF